MLTAPAPAKAPRSRRARGPGVGGWVVGLVLALGMFAGFATGVLPGAAQAAGRGLGVIAPSAPSTTEPAPTAEPSEEAPPGEPQPILATVSPGPPPDPARVADRLRGVGPIGGQSAGMVTDAKSGEQLYAAGQDRPMIPASAQKLLTAASVLQLLGPDHRFSTSVVSAGDGRIVLVGGGDPYLASSNRRALPGAASVGELAKLTAAELAAQGVDSVELGYDAGLFAGPGWSPEWPEGYRDQVTTISALWLDGGYGAKKTRPKDPARAAADEFARALKANDIAVEKVAAAAGEGEPIAAVQSMPLALIVEQVISRSDNNAAEVLLRQAGLAAGGDGSFVSGQEAVAQSLGELEMPADGIAISDGSGLSRENRATVGALAAAVRLGVAGDERFRSIATGMSVAGAEGTLRQRFVESGTEAGRGEVRAKTGTLRQVHALAGYVVAEDGSLLAYAFLVNGDAEENGYADRTWLDRMAAALAACGCR